MTPKKKSKSPSRRRFRQRKTKTKSSKRFFTHVQKYREDHPEIPFKSVLTSARKTFKGRKK